MTQHGTEEADQSTQEPEELQQETTGGSSLADGARTTPLSDRQRAVLIRLLRVAYPHDRFPDGPYERTADAVAAAADGSDLTDGLDALDADGFTDLDDAAAAKAIDAVGEKPFFTAIHATTVVALYDDREVWQLLGYEGSSFEKGGYVDRGFDDLDWLPDPRITESDEPRVEIVPEEGYR